ncbi:hypothetical protein CXQ81_13040 [Pseudomonas sp. 09C 129]|uniref:hypothetical protein n=1 Tax=Pseudomonas sp. 09C 129 TaxID=2054915 RepID=UPI000C6C9DB6|nr:hypothetical protein [Pseudomonas sp. 09C 129]AUG01488.1 hypothetical protein CXQ81_13040 [Pseudomonas sp. 09C 129]
MSIKGSPFLGSYFIRKGVSTRCFFGRVGQKVLLTAPQLRNYLAAQQIKEKDIGGNLDLPVSQAETHKNGQFPAKYFVVHDTSTPILLKAPFPKDMGTVTWKHNDVSVWQKGEKSKAHVFISRHGQSVTAMPFERGWRSTKFELTYNKRYPHVPDEEVRGRFLHVELVQPRRSAPVTDKNASEKKIKNGAVAPIPGFTVSQYRRLALVYIAASLRAGEWLIPAFHADLDLGIDDAHDDPQNFQLNLWADELQSLLNEIES